MAYDEGLVERIRDRLGPIAAFEEKRMFGGLAFLVDGHITVAASSKGGLMVHVDPDEAHLLVQEAGVERMVMNGKALDGWMWVEAGAVEDDDALAVWVDRGVIAAKSMS